MQAIANWLVARPQNAVLGLVVTLLLPAPQLTSGAILALLVLAQGARFAAIEAIVATGVLVVTSLIMGGSLASVIGLTAGTYVPVMLLAVLLVTMRSLTLALQMSVIVAVAALLIFQLAVPDPVAFWQPYLDQMALVIQENGLQLDTQLLTAEVMTVSAVLVFWMLNSVALLFGYGLYQSLARETSNYGRFSDLSFGRVIAVVLVLAGLLTMVIDAAWIQNIAFILFVIFMMQGLAIMHWLRGEGMLPAIALVSLYVLLPFLQILLVMALALVGFTDVWFDFRRRLKKT